MSLPPTLLQRLASRGLLNKQKAQASQSEAIEEIIAENYDEDDKGNQYSNSEQEAISTTTKHTGSTEHFWQDRIKERIGVTESHQGFKFCPNKYNVYHSCSLYCVNRWQAGHPKANEKYLRRYKRLVRKYPLSADWKEMYDNGCAVYYFYNSTTRKVSWLPPTHPKARISNSAAIFRKQLANSNDKYNFETPYTSNNHEMDDGVQAPSFAPSKKQKVRDLERTLSRKQRV